MKKTTSLHPLLRRMTQIARMERGTLCRLAGRPDYNHQTWHEGRNVVRYVPREQVPALQAAIEGYRRFMALAEAYAEEVIRRTRHEQALLPTRSSRRGASPTRRQRHARNDV